MTTVGLDTSVVLRLLTGEPVTLATKAVEFLDECLAKRREVFVPDLVVAETYFALQHHYGVPKSEALDALRAFLESGDVTASSSMRTVLNTPRLATAKPGFVDRLIHAQIREQGGKMASFERAAGKLEGTAVL